MPQATNPIDIRFDTCQKMIQPLYLLLGVSKMAEMDGVRLLKHILRRYGVSPNLYRIGYCYHETPPSRINERKEYREAARVRLEETWLNTPAVIIGMGWMACEMLTGRSKTKLKNMTGTRWQYVGNIARIAWVTYDPAACLYDPGLTVDIAAVIVAAGKEAGLPMHLTNELETTSLMNKIWQRYL
jgi:hypothetical protein